MYPFPAEFIQGYTEDKPFGNIFQEYMDNKEKALTCHTQEEVYEDSPIVRLMRNVKVPRDWILEPEQLRQFYFTIGLLSEYSGKQPRSRTDFCFNCYSFRFRVPQSKNQSQYFYESIPCTWIFDPQAEGFGTYEYYHREWQKFMNTFYGYFSSYFASRKEDGTDIIFRLPFLLTCRYNHRKDNPDNFQKYYFEKDEPNPLAAYPLYRGALTKQAEESARRKLEREKDPKPSHIIEEEPDFTQDSVMMLPGPFLINPLVGVIDPAYSKAISVSVTSPYQNFPISCDNSSKKRSGLPSSSSVRHPDPGVKANLMARYPHFRQQVLSVASKTEEDFCPPVLPEPIKNAQTLRKPFTLPPVRFRDPNPPSPPKLPLANNLSNHALAKIIPEVPRNSLAALESSVDRPAIQYKAFDASKKVKQGLLNRANKRPQAPPKREYIDLSSSPPKPVPRSTKTVAKRAMSPISVNNTTANHTTVHGSPKVSRASPVTLSATSAFETGPVLAASPKPKPLPSPLQRELSELHASLRAVPVPDLSQAQPEKESTEVANRRLLQEIKAIQQKAASRTTQQNLQLTASPGRPNGTITQHNPQALPQKPAFQSSSSRGQRSHIILPAANPAKVQTDQARTIAASWTTHSKQPSGMPRLASKAATVTNKPKPRPSSVLPSTSSLSQRRGLPPPAPTYTRLDDLTRLAQTREPRGFAKYRPNPNRIDVDRDTTAYSTQTHRINAETEETEDETVSVAGSGVSLPLTRRSH